MVAQLAWLYDISILLIKRKTNKKEIRIVGELIQNFPHYNCEPFKLPK